MTSNAFKRPSKCNFSLKKRAEEFQGYATPSKSARKFSIRNQSNQANESENNGSLKKDLPSWSRKDQSNYERIIHTPSRRLVSDLNDRESLVLLSNRFDITQTINNTNIGFKSYFKHSKRLEPVMYSIMTNTKKWAAFVCHNTSELVDKFMTYPPYTNFEYLSNIV